MGRRRALLIGVCAYPGAPLENCLRDVELSGQRLRDVFSFSDITMLRDHEATTANMKAALLALTAGAVPGDVLFFHYSGHGAQVRTTALNEPDFRDEVLCPVDFDWSLAHMITDNEFGRLTRVPSGVNLTVLLDSCHSGGMLRALPGPGNPRHYRTMPITREQDIAISQPGGRGFRPWFNMRPKLRAFGRSAAMQSAVLLSATTAQQLAADGGPETFYHGAHTWAVFQAISEGATRYHDVVRGARLWLEGNGYGGREGQIPCLQGWSGARKLPFLQPFA
jgi:uncharacterized caspase-like protein